MSKSLSSKVSSWRLSWDAVLFIMLWLSQFWSSEVAGMVLPSQTNNVSLIVHLTRVFNYDPIPALLLLVLALYVGADLWLAARTQFRVKLVAVWISIIAFVILPTIVAIIYRQNTAPHLYVHDGAIQIEEAIKFMLAGKNPYVENYLATPMAQWPFHEPALDTNPALYHLPYLPGMLLISIPFYLLSQATLGWYDQRFVYLLMLFGLALLLLRTAQTPRAKLVTLIITLLNPLIAMFFVEGRNDIVVLFWLVGAIFFLQRNHNGWAGVWVALAAGSKQTAWFILPFFVFYALQIEQHSDTLKRIRRAHVLVPAALVFAGILLPFLIWDVRAFLDAVLSLPSGLPAAGAIYPIRSLGLGGLALGLGWIKHSTDPFPFSWFQILFGGLGLVFLLYAQWRNNTLTQMLMNYALLLVVYLFFARSFVDNYLGFAVVWLVLPRFLRDSKPN